MTCQGQCTTRRWCSLGKQRDHHITSSHQSWVASLFWTGAQTQPFFKCSKLWDLLAWRKGNEADLLPANNVSILAACICKHLPVFFKPSLKWISGSQLGPHIFHYKLGSGTKFGNPPSKQTGFESRSGIWLLLLLHPRLQLASSSF